MPSLGNRKQEILLDRVHSTQADVVSAVPQRTVLRLILLLAYINDLSVSFRTTDRKLFADYSLLYCIVNKTGDNDKLQRDLSSLK